jgi:hypothetical protein
MEFIMIVEVVEVTQDSWRKTIGCYRGPSDGRRRNGERVSEIEAAS